MTALSLVWVAAHLGLRQQRPRGSIELARNAEQWRYVHDITKALGNPPAPYMGGASR